MTDVPAEMQNAQTTPSPLFKGSTRWGIAILLVMGPLLQAIEFVLKKGEQDTATRVAAWSAFPERLGLSMASGLLAIPFLLAGIAVIVALTRIHSRRLAWTGGAFMVSAMTGLAVAHGYELAAFGLALTGKENEAISVLNAENLGLPGIVFLLMFLGGAVLGTLILAAAAWRSPYVPRLYILFLLAFAVLDFAVGQGMLSHVVNFVGSLILAFAVLTGYARSSHRAATPAVQHG
jgi:hypothetical protein